MGMAMACEIESFEVLEGPALSAVAAFLDSVNLPASDLCETDMSRFLYVGQRHHPVGIVGFEAYNDLGLLRSLAVHPEYRQQGIGELLLNRVEQQAWDHGVRKLYLLTLDADGYFAHRFFRPIPREQAPPEIIATSQYQSLCPTSARLMLKEL